MKRIIMMAALIAVVSPLLASNFFDQGTTYYKAKSYVKAREAFQNEVNANPSNGMAWYFLGEVCKNLTDFAAAENAYRNAVSKPIQRKYLSLAYWNLLVLVEQRNDISEIIRTSRDFWRNTGDDGAKRKVDEMINKMIWTDNQQAIDLYKEGCDLRDQNKTDEAHQKFLDAGSADSTFLAPHFELGQILYAEGKHNEAAEQFRIIAEKVPYYSAVNLLLGEIYYNEKSYQPAADALDKALEFGFFDKDTVFATNFKLAAARFSLRDFEKAEDAAEKALTINGSDKDALMLMSAIDIKLDRYDEALKTLIKLQSFDQDNADILYQIGSIYYRQQNAEKYTKSFDQLFTLSTKGGSQVPAKYQKAMSILSKHLFTRGNFVRVTEIFSALPESARDTDMSLIAAKSYAHQKYYDTAISLFEKLSLNSDDRFTLCQCYVHAGMKQKAKTALMYLINANTSYRDKAVSDTALAPIAKEIAAEQTKAQQQSGAAQTKTAQPSGSSQQESAPAGYDAPEIQQ
jgi:tetratricopeptide (TPR) repeat protein